MTKQISHCCLDPSAREAKRRIPSKYIKTEKELNIIEPHKENDVPSSPLHHCKPENMTQGKVRAPVATPQDFAFRSAYSLAPAMKPSILTVHSCSYFENK